MTKTVEVLDALMGSGKTHAIIEYMATHQQRPWLYISPMLEETETRVPERASELNMELFVPYEDNLYTKSETCLKALSEARNICCTHNLMHKFTKQHLRLIEEKGYQVVSDEELNLINGYNISKVDYDFLVRNKMLDIDEQGKVTFLDQEMDNNARYGDIKAKADLGMLYSAQRSNRMMVIQLSPMIIDASSRFILLTYNYKGSIMNTFLDMHKYQYKEFDEVKLYKTNTEIIKELQTRISFIETPSVKRIQQKYTLSKSWWTNSTVQEKTEISKAIRACMKKVDKKRENLFYTLPKDYVGSGAFDKKFIGAEPMVDTEGNTLEHTRTFIACNARSTNLYADKEVAVHAYNLFPNQAVKAFLQDKGYECNDDLFALNMLLQWLFRGCIRKKGDSKLHVALLSKRMNILFKEWLMKATLGK